MRGIRAFPMGTTLLVYYLFQVYICKILTLLIHTYCLIPKRLHLFLLSVSVLSVFSQKNILDFCERKNST